jgi:LacI family transcriptional regulator
MRDVAAAAGVSQPAVSLALRGDPRIPAATRERVMAAAARLGYRPDPLVSTLMAQRRGRRAGKRLGTLGVVSLWPNRRESWRTLSFYAPYREGILERARELGYGVDLLQSDGSAEDGRRLLRTLQARGIQGLVFTQAHESVTALPFDIAGFAAAYIGTGIRTPHLSRVDAALDFDLRLAWTRARAAGGRRIGLVTWELLSEKNEGAWLGAFLNAQRKLADADRLAPLVLEAIDAAPALAWIERHRPDAVLSENGWLLGRLRAAYPEIRYYSLALMPDEDLPGVVVGRRGIGAAAVDMVVAQLNRGERGVPAIPKRVLVEGGWRE